jgi:hypothetical protein
MFDHCLYFNTSALARRLEREWSAAFASFDLTPPQAFTLRAVVDRPGMLQGELAQELAIARATATRALDGLESKGLIKRHSHERDGQGAHHQGVSGQCESCCHQQDEKPARACGIQRCCIEAAYHP